MKKLLLTLILVFPSVMLYSKENKNSESKNNIEWTTLPNAEKILSKNNKKKLLIFFYTNCCTYCTKMEKKTFLDKEVVKYINKNYVAVKIDGKTKEPIDYKKRKYVYISLFGVNGLIYTLLDGTVIYPSVVCLGDDIDKKLVLKGFVRPEELVQKLKYFDLQNPPKENPTPKKSTPKKS